MVRQRIKNQVQNDDMYSTDEEKAQEDVLDNNNENLTESVMQDEGKHKFRIDPKKQYQKINSKMENIIAGPYQVEFYKPYKPIFICFVDIMFGISFLVFTNLYAWE